jgi:DNA-binding transcriptional ArsR family regulator
MSDWSFLSNHGRALLCIAHDPEVRLRDIGQNLGITERRAYDLVIDLTEAGYLIKERQGRRNRYQVQEHLPRPEAPEHDQSIGDVLALLTQQQNVHPSRKKAELRRDH